MGLLYYGCGVRWKCMELLATKAGDDGCGVSLTNSQGQSVYKIFAFWQDTYLLVLNVRRTVFIIIIIDVFISFQSVFQYVCLCICSLPVCPTVVYRQVFLPSSRVSRSYWVCACLSECISVFWTVCLPLRMYSPHMSVFKLVCFQVYLSTCASTLWLFTCLPASLSPHHSVSPPVCLSASLFPCQSVSSPFCYPASLSPCQSISPLVCLPASLSPRQSVSPPFCYPASLFSCQSVSSPVCLPASLSPQSVFQPNCPYSRRSISRLYTSARAIKCSRKLWLRPVSGLGEENQNDDINRRPYNPISRMSSLPDTPR